MIVNNSTIIIMTNNHLTLQIIEYKKKTAEYDVRIPGSLTKILHRIV